MIGTRTLWIGLFGTFALGGQAVAQSTWYVDVTAAPGGNGSIAAPYDSIQTGIAQGTTLSGDTMLVSPGQYLEDINFLGKSIDVRGTAGASTTVVVGQAGSVVTVANGESAARLEGLTLREGTGTLSGTDLLGGGIYLNGATLDLVNCEVLSNTADLGGGIYCLGGAIQIQGTLIQNNVTSGDGGGMHVDGTATAMNASIIRGNQVAKGQGAGLWSGPTGTLLVTNSTVRECQIVSSWSSNPGAGAGVWLSTPNALLQDCVIRNNWIGDGLSNWASGGGVACSAASAQFVRCVIRNNLANNGDGGGFYGSGQLDDCDLLNNHAVRGGGVRATSNLVAVNCRISSNRVSAITGECTGAGAGVYRGTYLQCEISFNLATVEGGGAYGATLNGCSITNNQGTVNCSETRGGGGISNCTATDCLIQFNEVNSTTPSFPTTIGGGGALSSTLVNCQILDNRVNAGPPNSTSTTHRAFGGGAFDSQLTGCLVARNSLQAHNAAGGKGGGVYGGTAQDCQILDNQASMLAGANGPSLGGGAANTTLTRCVLIGNTADHGGGFWQGTASNCTLTENNAAIDGGGISSAPETVGENGVQTVLENCIVWNNAPDQVAAGGGTLTATYSDVQGGHAGTGNIDSDPLFWAVALDDVELRPGSPAIDAGNPGSPPDPDGSISDMGALPFDSTHSSPPAVYCQAKLNSAGTLPSISYSGSATTSGADDFFVVATLLVPQKPSMAIWSMGAADTPFFGGTLCLASPISRTTVTPSSGAGDSSFHFSQTYLVSKGLAAGDRIYAQFWQRDPAHLDGTGIGLSDGLDFTLLP